MELRDAQRMLENLAHGQSIVLSRHCRERMAEREITYTDLIFALNQGQAVQVRHNETTGQDIITVEGGRDAEGEAFILQVVILETECLIRCITVY